MNPTPLRSQEERLHFCDTYFAAVGAKTVYRSGEYREYELPRDVDKELTDRPYYWMWVERTQQDVKPTVLRVAFSEDSLTRENQRLRTLALAEFEQSSPTDTQRMFFRPPSAELMSLGCFRLDKIFTSLSQRGAHACVKPARAQQGVELTPWLLVAFMISKRCDLTQEVWKTVGIGLRDGQIVDGLFDLVQRIDMTNMDPNDPALLPKKLSFEQGFSKIREHVEQQIQQMNHDWADDAEMRLREELQQVETYYQSILPDVPPEEHILVTAEQIRKKQELHERMSPRIDIEVRQMALLGLAERH